MPPGPTPAFAIPPLRTDTRRICAWAAVTGTIAWSVAVLALHPAWPEALVLLAALALVPLGFRLVLRAQPQPEHIRMLTLAAGSQLPAALVLVAAFSLPPGTTAALLTLPWLAVTVTAAAAGVQRLVRRGLATPLADLCFDAGLVYLAVAGVWTVLSRLGARPMHFEDVIVLLTAAHFHYAGFVLPLMAGAVTRAAPSLPTRLTVGGVVAGVPLVALGIAFSPEMEVGAAGLLVLACGALAFAQLRLALQSARWAIALPQAASALSLMAAMGLAAIYAAGEYTGNRWLEIPDMLPYHGAVNALGFGLLGLVGWNVDPRGANQPPAL